MFKLSTNKLLFVIVIPDYRVTYNIDTCPLRRQFQKFCSLGIVCHTSTTAFGRTSRSGYGIFVMLLMSNMLQLFQLMQKPPIACVLFISHLQGLCDAARPPIEILTDKAVEPGATLSVLWCRPQPRKRMANGVTVVILQGSFFQNRVAFGVQSPLNQMIYLKQQFQISMKV